MRSLVVETAEQAVAVLRRVPDGYRRFTVDSAEMVRVHRVDAPLLEQLLDHGLPHDGSGRGRRFDLLDAENLGLLLRLPSPRRLGMRRWSKVFRAAHADRVDPVTVTLQASAPLPRGDERCALHQEVLAAVEPGSVREVAPGSFTLRPKLEPIKYDFDASHAWLLRRGESMQFHFLPHALRYDVAFATQTGLADCRLAAHVLVTEAGQRGVPARKGVGFLMGRPYASWHAWVELRVGSRWVAADPFLLTTLARWGFIDPESWPPHRSPHFLLWRLGSEYVPLMWQGGVELPQPAALVTARPT